MVSGTVCTDGLKKSSPAKDTVMDEGPTCVALSVMLVFAIPLASVTALTVFVPTLKVTALFVIGDRLSGSTRSAVTACGVPVLMRLTPLYRIRDSSRSTLIVADARRAGSLGSPAKFKFTAMAPGA